MSTQTKYSPIYKNLMQRLRSTHLEGQTFLLLGVFIVLAAFFSITESRFLTNRSITSMAFQLPEIGVLSLAMMITILVGGINLSVNATSNLAAVVAGLFLVHILPADAALGIQNLYVALAMGIALLIGLLCGVLNGFLVGIIQVPPILATLATFTFFTGISTGLTGGATVTGFPPGLAVLGAQSLLGIPIPFLVFVLLTIFIFVLLNQTTYGFKMRMLGSNPTAANFTGVNNKVIIMQVYILSGLLSAITGMIIMSRTMSAAYEYGTTTYVLLTILISVLAGILPGFGSVFNIFVAVLILQVLSTGFHMILAGVRGSAFFRDFAWGILLIIIFIINFFIRSKKQKE